MRRLRDVFYVNANFDESYFEYYGMEFSEFIQYNPLAIHHILLLEPELWVEETNRDMYMSMLNDKSIAELSRHGAYEFGDFHWMDHAGDEALSRCTEQEKAEILYLNHYGKPLCTAFFETVDNRFVYLAHDDGWYCRLYCKDMAVFGDIIANKIVGFFSTNKRRKIYPIDDGIKAQLLEWARGGLLINFHEASVTGRSCQVNFYEIGKYSDMDEMYHNLNQKLRYAKRTGWLEQKNKAWKMDYSERMS